MRRGADSSGWDIDAWPTARKLAVLAAALTVAAVLAATSALQSKAAGDSLAARPKPAPVDLLAQVREARPVAALWVGDSFTAGTGTKAAELSEACQASELLEWVCVQDAQGGTGFVADGKVNSPSFGPLKSRLARTAADRPNVDVVVVDAGRNDAGVPAARFAAAATEYFDALTAAYPDRPVIVVAPYFLGADGPSMTSMRAYLSREANRRGWYFIDPLAEGWPQRLGGLRSPDGVHPTPAGHMAIAKELADEIQRLGIQTAR